MMKNKLSKRETVLTIFILSGIMLTVAKLFYGTFFAAVFLLPFMIPLYKQRKKQLLERKVQKYEMMFKDMLIALSDALKAGYSVENAMIESYQSVQNLYGTRSEICAEMRWMLSQLQLNVPIELIFKEFAGKTKLKDAVLFYEIFAVAKKVGGNMSMVIKSVTDSIVLKESVKAEIDVEINGKKMEHRVMMVIPIFLILYVSISSKGFLDVMYETVLGKIIMSICILGYCIAYLWGAKIVCVEV